MNCLITGVSGFIGNALLGKLKSEGNKTVGIVRDIKARDSSRNAPDVIVRGDIRDCNFLRRVITDYDIEEVYHCAARAIVKTCAHDPYNTYDVNIMGTVALLEACRNSGDIVKSIVVSTSDKAFGHAPIPYTEETHLNPLYTYETSKACQQLIALSYFNNYGLPVKVVASSNVYGPGDPNSSRIIPNTIINLSNDKPALLNNGSASHIRELIYVDDVVNAFIAVSRNGKNGNVYCCGGTEHLSIADLMKKLCILMGKDPDKYIKVFQKSRYLKEIEKQYIDSTKLQSLGWKPEMKLDDGLRRSIEYYSKIKI